MDFFEIQYLATRSDFCDGRLDLAQILNCCVCVGMYMCMHAYICCVTETEVFINAHTPVL